MESAEAVASFSRPLRKPTARRVRELQLLDGEETSPPPAHSIRDIANSVVYQPSNIGVTQSGLLWASRLRY